MNKFLIGLCGKTLSVRDDNYTFVYIRNNPVKPIPRYFEWHTYVTYIMEKLDHD